MLYSFRGLPVRFRRISHWPAGQAERLIFLYVNMARAWAPSPTTRTKGQFFKTRPRRGNPHIAPGPNDRRGPCPGLNTLANHGVSFNVKWSSLNLSPIPTFRHHHATGDRNGVYSACAS